MLYDLWQAETLDGILRRIAEMATQGFVAYDTVHCRSEFGDTFDGHQEAVNAVFDEIMRTARKARTDDGPPMAHRLKQYVRKTFIPGRQHEQLAMG